MINYSRTKIEEVERVFNPVCLVPFFQHATSVEATTISGRQTNIYKVGEGLPDSTACLFYWVQVRPGERQLDCSCSWHRCTGEMCQHMAAVLLFKWFELTGETHYFPHDETPARPGLGDGPLALQQAREITFLHFEFEEDRLRQRLIELRQRYHNPILRRWYARPRLPKSQKQS